MDEDGKTTSFADLFRELTRYSTQMAGGAATGVDPRHEYAGDAVRRAIPVEVGHALAVRSQLIDHPAVGIKRHDPGRLSRR